MSADLETSLATIGLNMNLSKTKILTPEETNIQINGTTIENVTE